MIPTFLCAADKLNLVTIFNNPSHLKQVSFANSPSSFVPGFKSVYASLESLENDKHCKKYHPVHTIVRQHLPSAAMEVLPGLGVAHFCYSDHRQTSGSTSLWSFSKSDSHLSFKHSPYRLGENPSLYFPSFYCAILCSCVVYLKYLTVTPLRKCIQYLRSVVLFSSFSLQTLYFFL